MNDTFLINTLSMKKELLTGLFALSALAVGAQTFTEWQDPEVNAVNRYPMHTNYFAYESLESAQVGQKKLSANYMTLNGLWKFNWKPALMTRLGTTCLCRASGKCTDMATLFM